MCLESNIDERIQNLSFLRIEWISNIIIHHTESLNKSPSIDTNDEDRHKVQRCLIIIVQFCGECPLLFTLDAQTALYSYTNYSSVNLAL